MKPIHILYICLLGALPLSAQQVTLEKAIRMAHENSYDAQLAKFTFMASYWSYRSFKAQLLPAVNLSGTLLNFDHSLVEARNYDDGKVAYVNNNSLENSLTLSLDQQVVATGGTVSLQSYLYRLDQFTYGERTYNSQPLRISYTQPLRAFNSLKWEKKTAPVEYEIAQRTYLASMEDITLQTTSLFFAVLSAQSLYKQAMATVKDRESLYGIAQQRLALGTTTKSEVLQMELSLLNARMDVTRNGLSLQDALYDLFSYLRVSDYDKAELLPPQDVPDLTVGFDEVMRRAIDNSSHSREQRLLLLEAQQSLAQAKANRGLQMTLSGQVGFTQSATSLQGAYRDLRDNEIVGLTLSLPIFDWGVSRGKVKMAQAQLDVVRTRVEKTHQDYLQELRRKVVQFNSQPAQCRDARRAGEIAAERYAITLRRFEQGHVTVTELNTAQQEMEAARSQYISQLQAFWTDYYSLQKSTLYDWLARRSLTADFESIVK